MAHTHGNEYQIRIVHEDGTEELSGWMQSEAQVEPAIAAIRRPRGIAYWLRMRHVLCSHCGEKDREISEFPLTGIPSSRHSPHDSEYLLAVGRRNRPDMSPPRRTVLARDTTTLYSIALEIVASSTQSV